jgi:hypothetical protein
MSYQETIDIKFIRSWVKQDYGIMTEVARDLNRTPQWVSKVINGHGRSAEVVEKCMEKIIERQTRMINYMAKIRQNAEIINQMQFQ